MTMFNYIAYESATGKPLAHGRTHDQAEEAVRDLSDLDAPGEARAPAQIVHAGDNGPYLWANKSPFATAQALAMAVATSTNAKLDRLTITEGGNS
jgi:hypothetical protein